MKAATTLIVTGRERQIAKRQHQNDREARRRAHEGGHDADRHAKDPGGVPLFDLGPVRMPDEVAGKHVVDSVGLDLDAGKIGADGGNEAVAESVAGNANQHDFARERGRRHAMIDDVGDRVMRHRAGFPTELHHHLPALVDRHVNIADSYAADAVARKVEAQHCVTGVSVDEGQVERDAVAAVESRHGRILAQHAVTVIFGVSVGDSAGSGVEFRNRREIGIRPHRHGFRSGLFADDVVGKRRRAQERAVVGAAIDLRLLHEVVAVEGVVEIGRALRLYRVCKGEVVTRSERGLNSALSDTLAREPLRDRLAINVRRVALAEEYVEAHDRNLIIGERGFQARLDAARPWPTAKFRDALVVDLGDYDDAGGFRGIPVINPDVRNLEVGRLEDLRALMDLRHRNHDRETDHDRNGGAFPVS